MVTKQPTNYGSDSIGPSALRAEVQNSFRTKEDFTWYLTHMSFYRDAFLIEVPNSGYYFTGDGILSLPKFHRCPSATLPQEFSSKFCRFAVTEICTSDNQNTTAKNMRVCIQTKMVMNPLSLSSLFEEVRIAHFVERLMFR